MLNSENKEHEKILKDLNAIMKNCGHPAYSNYDQIHMIYNSGQMDAGYNDYGRIFSNNPQWEIDSDDKVNFETLKEIYGRWSAHKCSKTKKK